MFLSRAIAKHASGGVVIAATDGVAKLNQRVALRRPPGVARRTRDTVLGRKCYADSK